MLIAVLVAGGFPGRLAVSTDDRKIKFYDMHTWEVVMEVELQNPALCLCSWKHLDTEMFGACSSILFHLVSLSLFEKVQTITCAVDCWWLFQ